MLSPLIRATQEIWPARFMTIPAATAEKSSANSQGSSMISHRMSRPSDPLSNRTHSRSTAMITPYRLSSSLSINPARSVSDTSKPRPANASRRSAKLSSLRSRSVSCLTSWRSCSSVACRAVTSPIPLSASADRNPDGTLQRALSCRDTRVRLDQRRTRNDDQWPDPGEVLAAGPLTDPPGTPFGQFQYPTSPLSLASPTVRVAYEDAMAKVHIRQPLPLLVNDRHRRSPVGSSGCGQSCSRPGSPTATAPGIWWPRPAPMPTPAERKAGLSHQPRDRCPSSGDLSPARTCAGTRWPPPQPPGGCLEVSVMASGSYVAKNQETPGDAAHCSCNPMLLASDRALRRKKTPDND